ncbi:unnamed protein product [Mycena citricolor]|uniref:Uncharacterized protein n=1 Tax=Mycena citricolor TaxID=2018698 RepID=A0AAD2HGF2_9AGAR|nr:unnamed protein product [Mycena citricolor]
MELHGALHQVRDTNSIYRRDIILKSLSTCGTIYHRKVVFDSMHCTETMK